LQSLIFSALTIDEENIKYLEDIYAKGTKSVVIMKTSGEVRDLDKYKELNISIIDNFDMITGKIALVLVLGGLEGSYGVDSTQLMPQYQEEPDKE
ncbi:MAG: hypothetical protein KAS39_02125, partial [Actinomycetia bacterium]|nr:hypothetical protein [Actinomycetes bacterium]